MRNKIYYIVIFLISFLLTGSGDLLSQDLIKPRLSISYYKIGKDKRQLKTRTSARINRKTELLEGVKIAMYHTEKVEDNFLGTIVTDKNGSGILIIPSSFTIVSDTTNDYIFIGVIENQSEYVGIEKEIEISNAFVNMDFLEEDSLRTVDVTVFQRDFENNKIPIEDIEVKVFVKRPFGDLPINKEELYTDEDGKVQVDFPNDLPADSLNSVKVIVRIEDDDIYGNLEASSRVDWGLTRDYDDKTLQRSLWAAGANAPLWLMFFTNSLIAVVWGIIFYIIYQIYNIYKA